MTEHLQAWNAGLEGWSDRVPGRIDEVDVSASSASHVLKHGQRMAGSLSATNKTYIPLILELLFLESSCILYPQKMQQGLIRFHPHTAAYSICLVVRGSSNSGRLVPVRVFPPITRPAYGLAPTHTRHNAAF